MKLEYARAKHQKLVQAHMRLRDKGDKLVRQLARNTIKLDASQRAIARSQKRLDKLVAAKRHNTGPTAEVVESLVDIVCTP